MENISDLEKARQYFKRQLHQLSDYFGEEKHPEKIAAVKIALELIEKETQRESIGDLHSVSHCHWCGQKIDWKGSESYE